MYNNNEFVQAKRTCFSSCFLSKECQDLGRAINKHIKTCYKKSCKKNGNNEGADKAVAVNDFELAGNGSHQIKIFIRMIGRSR